MELWYIYMITHIINWFILRVYMVYDVYDIFIYSYLCGLRNWLIVFGGQGKDGEGAHCERHSIWDLANQWDLRHDCWDLAKSLTPLIPIESMVLVYMQT